MPNKTSSDLVARTTYLVLFWRPYHAHQNKTSYDVLSSRKSDCEWVLYDHFYIKRNLRPTSKQKSCSHLLIFQHKLIFLVCKCLIHQDLLNKILHVVLAIQIINCEWFFLWPFCIKFNLRPTSKQKTCSHLLIFQHRLIFLVSNCPIHQDL